MRTEQEILKDFEKLGYEINFNDEEFLYLKDKHCEYIIINKKLQKYGLSEFAELTRKEHKLLDEFFEIWEEK